jgi:hypothetical protein
MDVVRACRSIQKTLFGNELDMTFRLETALVGQVCHVRMPGYLVPAQCSQLLAPAYPETPFSPRR